MLLVYYVRFDRDGSKGENAHGKCDFDLVRALGVAGKLTIFQVKFRSRNSVSCIIYLCFARQ